MPSDLVLEAPVETASPTARSLLVGWANQQDAWIRMLVSDVIVTAKPVVDRQLNGIFDLFLREKHLREGDTVAVELLRDDPVDAGVKEQLALSVLEQLEYINALATGQRINFASKLTIIFGENAAGKTGYVRVLKRAAAVRTAEPILPDINGTNPGAPTARFIYSLGGADVPLDWHDQAGVAPLNRIDVFDARASLLHVDTDLSYIYTPGELSRFPLVQAGIDQIRGRLEGAIKTAAGTTNPFTSHFERASRVYAVIEALGAATDLNHLRTLATVTADDEAQREALRAEIEALKSTTPQAQLRLADAQKQRAAKLIAAVETLRKFDAVKYNETCGRYREAREGYERATASSFAGVDIPGVLKEDWKQFIQAGEAYLQHLESRATYPHAGDQCLYCRQPLGPDAVRLIQKYRDYCSGSFRADLDRAAADLDRHAQPVLALDTTALTTHLAEFAGGSGFLSDGEQRELAALLARAGELQPTLQRRDGCNTDALAGLSDSEKTLRSAAGRTEALVRELKDRAGQRDQILKERQAQLLDIEARQKLAKLMPEIEKYVGAAKWVDQAKIQARRFPGILRSLTEASKAASQELLNGDFERRFLEECRKLRAPKVRLEFPGRQGQVTRHKAVAADRRPSEVLSEGEQKVIALADFLAEVGLKPAAPVVFDDPITSLDYRRMSEVVARIVELTQTRQVVVFTHNIWFTTELLAAFEKSPQDCAYYDVSRNDDHVGVITKGTHPRADTFKASKGRINELIQTPKNWPAKDSRRSWRGRMSTCATCVRSSSKRTCSKAYRSAIRRMCG
jgi:hypothetical protein